MLHTCLGYVIQFRQINFSILRLNSPQSESHSFVGNNTFMREETVHNQIHGTYDIHLSSLLLVMNRTIYRELADKKLYIDSHNTATLKSVLVGNQFAKFHYFYVYVPLIQGPNGASPLLDVGGLLKIEKDIKFRNVVVGWTVSYPVEVDALFGYESEQVLRMREALDNITIEIVMLEVDALHASWSNNQLQSVLFATKYILFRTLEMSDETMSRVNYDHLRNMIFYCGLNRSYLDVSDELRNRLDLDNSTHQNNPQKNGQACGRSQLLVWTLLLLCI